MVSSGCQQQGGRRLCSSREGLEDCATYWFLFSSISTSRDELPNPRTGNARNCRMYEALVSTTHGNTVRSAHRPCSPSALEDPTHVIQVTTPLVRVPVRF